MNRLLHLVMFVVPALASLGAEDLIVGSGGRHERISDALAAARIGDRVVVKPGVYRETLVWPAVHGIALIGEEGPERTIIEGDGRRPVIHMEGEHKWDTVIEGFTIRGGGGGHARGEMGAGLNILGSSPSVRNCVITGNSGRPYRGTGGIFLWGSRAIVEHNVIAENSYQSATLQAGGICVWEGMPKIERNVIRGNGGEQEAYFTRAAGIRLQGSKALVRSNVIRGNVSTSVGSALYASQGDRSCVFSNEITGNRNIGASFGAVAAEDNCSPLIGGEGTEANAIHDNIHAFIHDLKGEERIRNLHPDYLGQGEASFVANWFGAAAGAGLQAQLQKLERPPPISSASVEVEGAGLRAP